MTILFFKKIINEKLKKIFYFFTCILTNYVSHHGLRTPREEIVFSARPKIHSHSQIFRYGRSIFCLPHRPNFSDNFDLCLHWVSVVRALQYVLSSLNAVISTNESTRFLTGHVIYNPAYTYKLHLQTTHQCHNKLTFLTD